MQLLALLLSGLALTQALPAAQSSGNATLTANNGGCGSLTLVNEQYCERFCDVTSTIVNGPQQSASAFIRCNTESCKEEHANSVTITESFSVNAGFDAGPISDSTSFTWSKSAESDDTYSFTLHKGAAGYIMFTPYLHKVCGTLEKYTPSFETGQHGSSIPYCGSSPSSPHPRGVDKNACGKTPQLLSNGDANGEYDFCHADGKGCKSLKPNKN